MLNIIWKYLYEKGISLVKTKCHKNTRKMCAIVGYPIIRDMNV